jgi:hypothetical protein
MGACEGTFLPRILWKQHCPSAFQTMNCTPADYWLQKSVGQTTNRNRATFPSLFRMKFTQVPSQYSKQIGEGKVTIKVWVRAKAPSRCHLLALQTMNCTPVDYWLQKSMGQTTNTNRARLPSLFSMKFTQVPGKSTATNLQNKPCCPTIQLSFIFLMVQRDGEKWSWITSGNHTSIGIDWHPFGVLEADDYRLSQTVCNLAINWYLWIIYTCIKKKLNNCIQIA